MRLAPHHILNYAWHELSRLAEASFEAWQPGNTCAASALAMAQLECSQPPEAWVHSRLANAPTGLGMRFRLAFGEASVRFGFVVLTLSLPGLLGAQTISGTVVDPVGVPVVGVVLSLVDSTSNVVGRALSGENGEFRLNALGSGVYRIRTLRIGYAPQTSDLVRIGDGERVTRRLVLTALRVTLDTVRVAANNPCARAASDSTGLTFRIMEQARTAIIAVQLTGGQRTVAATTLGYDQVLDRTSKRVREHSTSVFTEFVSQPWLSRPPDQLRRQGYVVTEGDFVLYHAPGLDALVSDGFLEDHCMRIARSADSSLLIGVAFEPNSDRSQVSDIRGTIWVDRASLELRHIEFQYANVTRLQADNSGGSMDFARLRNGMWVVSDWSIRMPVMTMGTAAAMSPAEMRVSHLQVRGGRLILLRIGRDTLWTRGPLTLNGSVSDSASGAGIAGARVSLLGTPSATRTDTAGRFAMLDVLPGVYSVQIRTASLDSIGAVHQSSVVFVDTLTAVSLRAPTAGQVVNALCISSGTQKPAPTSAILGTVVVRGDSAPARGVEVIAEWREMLPHGRGGGIGWETRALRTKAGVTGSFRVCGVPTETSVSLRAESGRDRSGPVEVRLAPGIRFERAELVIDRSAHGSASFRGVVVDSSAQPLVGIEVVLPGLSRMTLTNERGEFRVSDIPAGVHQVLVRRIGYGALDATIEFGQDEAVDRRIVLTQTVLLDSIIVTASAAGYRMPGFEENRRVGLGRFLTRQDLAKQEGRSVSAVFAALPGVRLSVGRGNHAGITSSRGVRGSEAMYDMPEWPGAKRDCYASVYIDNVLVYAPGSRKPVFDLSSISVDHIEAIEYYAGPAQTPPQYNTLNSVCGVVVIWTRRSP